MIAADDAPVGDRAELLHDQTIDGISNFSAERGLGKNGLRTGI